MNEISVTKRINAPREKVFALFADLRNGSRHVSGILKLEVLTEGPIGKGTRFRETRRMFGKEATETMEIVEFSPPSGYTVTANSCGCAYRSTFTFTGVGDATDAEMRFSATPQSFLAKIMSPLAAMMSNTMRKLIDTDLEDLKRVAESGPA
ncbi:MAG: SRPBCC family protein [Phycisphaeraceae bacterium]|nr:SRPBCC family protein [Phycisphaeraceae bacterium]MBX3407788.1 SRPBCC family protein [Phycisphaeraceae bacterium]